MEVIIKSMNKKESKSTLGPLKSNTWAEKLRKVNWTRIRRTVLEILVWDQGLDL